LNVSNSSSKSSSSSNNYYSSNLKVASSSSSSLYVSDQEAEEVRCLDASKYYESNNLNKWDDTDSQRTNVLSIDVDLMSMDPR